MSADLFAEFTSAPASNQNQPSNARGTTGTQHARSFSFFDDLSNTAPAPATQPQQRTQNFAAPNYNLNHTAADDDNDDWGDFEGGSSFDPPAPAKADSFSFSLNKPSAPSQPADKISPINNDPFAFQSLRLSQGSGPSQFVGTVSPADNDPFGFQSVQPSSARTLERASPANNDPFSFQPHQTAHTPTPAQSLRNISPVHNDPFGFHSTQSSQPVAPLQSPGQPPTIQNDAFSFRSSHSSQPLNEAWQKAPVIKAKKSADPSVLFDAEDNLDDEDDFGDFEGTESNAGASAITQTSSGLADLLGDLSVSESKPPVSSQKGASGGPSNKRSGPLATSKRSTGGFGSMSNAKKQTKAASPPAPKQNDAWDTFDDWEATIPVKAASRSTANPQATKGTKVPDLPSNILSPAADNSKPGELPPTNVPPPGVLLSLFPPLFTEAQNTLFKPMAAQTLPMRNKILSEPATIAFLQGYLMLGSVAARVIAGRKLRWKRDQHLSQGMRIGPASSRATSGMKLMGIDKSENMKEEREASDVARAWKDQIGRLRHVVSAANQIKPGTLGSIPDIQEAMPVRTLKQAEGGVPAPQPCMMCGLKRDERVAAADHAVEDSFGEWWIDQVNMHRGCRNFWNEHRDKLRQR